MNGVPQIRIRAVNAAPTREAGAYVVYWMTAYRRTRANFALERAVWWATELDRPLVVLEPLRCDYPYASDRLHRFVIDGMADNEEALRESNALYYPYVEPSRGAGRGLLEAVAAQACVVVTDDWPAFFLPKMLAAAGRKLTVALEAVDSNGLLPMRATGRVFLTAASFRTYLSKNLGPHLRELPHRAPLADAPLRPLRALPTAIERRWPRASRALLDGDPGHLRALPIDHSVPPVAIRGGAVAAHRRLRAFVREKLAAYEDARSDPSVDGTSRLSPYLHFGHLGVHEVLDALVREEKQAGRMLVLSGRSRRGAVFGLGPPAEAFLDELVTWRELGFNMSSHREDAGDFDALPQWAKRTLDKHRADARPGLQSRQALEQGTTVDPMYNAAQRQLVQEGWFHNVARMIWGKKLLEYTRSPEEALKTMSELMSRYSLDGRDPNSLSGFFWVFGRYDRPWGPERPIFGTVRYMTSDTPEKLRRYRAYIERYAELPKKVSKRARVPRALTPAS